MMNAIGNCKLAHVLFNGRYVNTSLYYISMYTNTYVYNQSEEKRLMNLNIVILMHFCVLFKFNLCMRLHIW